MSALEVHDTASNANCDQIAGRAKNVPVAVNDGDACILSCDLNGSLRVIDANTATDDAAAPTKGGLILGKFSSQSPDANDAVIVRCGSTGEVIVSDIAVATEDAAYKTSGPQVFAKYDTTPVSVTDGDATALRATADGILLVQDQGLNTTGAAAATTGPLAMGVAGGTAAVHAGDAVPVSVDTTGAVNVASTTAAAFKAELGPYSYKHLAASGQVKNAAGFLHAVCINTPATASVITIYDNTGAAGDVIGIVTLDVGNLQPFQYVLDCTCATGIYLNASVAVDMTAIYR